MGTLRRLGILALVVGALCFWPSIPQHAQGTAVPGATVIATGITGTTFTDTTCPDGVTCTYYISAVDQFGESLDKTPATAAIPATGTHTVTLKWTASTTSGVTYTLYQGQPPNPPTGFSAVPN
jgi:hypothetical protein